MDTLLLSWMNDLRHPLLTHGMSLVTWLGSIIVLLPGALWLAWQGRGRFKRHWTFLPVAVLGAFILAQAIKWGVDRGRPDAFPSLIPLPADASFPSAHSMQVTAFVMAWLLSTESLRKTGPVLAGVCLVLLVSVSRLYLQVHFPSDVLFGILGGLLWVWGLQSLSIWRSR